METFYYKRHSGSAPPYNTKDALSFALSHLTFARFLDVLRAKGILTGWDVCDVLGEDWEPCEPDLPPPWDHTL